ncbi:dTDP-4-amino-4,6-dideoxygalactose transaminase [Candidatus Hydrogenedentota bacterium]
MVQRKIPFNVPYLTGKEEEYVLDALRSRAHCGNHAYADRCIELLKERYGFHSVFLTTSCTTAMEMGAILANLALGDEVILPSYTFTSTVNAIVLRGVRPVFCDVDPETMNIDVSLIEPLITEKTKMILPIDYAGIPCEIDAIMEIAQRRGLTVMQDAAQSFHSFHKDGRACGSVPPLAAFSFHESKNAACGEGGALIVNDPNLVDRARIVQEKGTDRALVLKGVQNKYGWADIGSSFLLADILAAMLLAQIEGTDEIVAKRGKVTQAYRELYKPYEAKSCLKMPKPPPGVKINNHAFFVVFDTEDNQKRFLSLLRTKEIHAYIGYVPLHSYVMGRKLGYRPEDVPLTENIAKRIVRLPFYADMADAGLDYCIEGMGDVLREIYGF